MTNAKTPTLALVGPTNVGKSTLFNKITNTRAAIVCDRPGVTVDRHELTLSESPVGVLRVIDTGGVGVRAREHPLGVEIERAAAKAVQDADIIGLVFDGTRDLNTEDLEIATWIRTQRLNESQKIVVLVNKSDSKKFDISTFYALGFENVLPVSAEHGHGMEDFWEYLSKTLGGEGKVSVESAQVERKETPRILVLGRPNVGKSTLLNSLIGEQRHVVSEIPGTTRDTIESSYFARGVEWTLIDTAGMRRPGRLERDVEWVAREKLKDQAKRADLAILMVDSSEGVTDQDAAIAGMAVEFGLSIIIAYNKWDKIQGERAEDFLVHLTRTKDLKFSGVEWCPAVRVSALTGKGIPELTKKIAQIIENREFRVSTSQLNQVFDKKLKYHPHPVGPRGKPAKFYYLSQVGVKPPQFVMFSNMPSSGVHVSYRRFVVNALRKEFGFEGTPVKIFFKQSASTR